MNYNELVSRVGVRVVVAQALHSVLMWRVSSLVARLNVDVEKKRWVLCLCKDIVS